MTVWNDNIATAPRDGTEFLAAIEVHTLSGAKFWERRVVAVDDETGEIGDDYDSSWSIDDYDLWISIPALPERKGPDHGRG
jgi:hypothetical protein